MISQLRQEPKLSLAAVATASISLGFNNKESPAGQGCCRSVPWVISISFAKRGPMGCFARVPL